MISYTFKLFGIRIFTFEVDGDYAETWGEEVEYEELTDRCMYYCTHCGEELVARDTPLDDEELLHLLRDQHREVCEEDW